MLFVRAARDSDVRNCNAFSRWAASRQHRNNIVKAPVAGRHTSPTDLSARREGARRTVYLLSALAVLGVAFLGLVLLQTQHWQHDHIDNTADQQTRLAVEFNNAVVGRMLPSTSGPEMEKRVAPGEFVPEAMSTSFVARRVL